MDECRSIIEPHIDDYDTPIEEEMTMKKPEVSRDVVDSREEFLSTYRAAHAVLHKLWSDAVGQEGYEKAPWRLLNSALERFARDAAEKVGIPRTEPLI